MVDISDTIEPGSTEYGDRQVLEDQMRQIQEQGNTRRPSTPGAATQRARDRLAAGPVSDAPVTDGLSVGPGAGPQHVANPASGPLAEKYRIMATEARNPYLRHLARNALRAMINEGA